MGIVTLCELLPNPDMVRTRKDIAKRLEMTREAMGLMPAELCRQSGIKPNAWSQYTHPDGTRRISLTAAYKLKDAFGIPLEWTFDADFGSLPDRLAQKLRRPAA